MRKTSILGIISVLIGLAACNAPSDEPVVQIVPTNTLLPIPSQTIRVTATIAPTSTDRPTFTPTQTETAIPPTPSNTPTPSLTPTVFGIVNAVNNINVREEPNTRATIITALPAGEGVQILGQDLDGSWLLIRLEDGREGWMASRYIFIEPSSTPFPTVTASPDRTALFLGTPLPPTELIPGRATATPPQQVQTGTVVTASANNATPATQGAIPGVPTIDSSTIFQTATALAGGSAPSESPATEATTDRVITAAPQPTEAATTARTVTPDASPTRVGRTIRIFAFCDDPVHGAVSEVPFIREGDSVEIWWGWIASTEQQVRDHLEASNLELTINGEAIDDASDYITDIQPYGGQYIVYWEIPYGPLTTGEYTVGYQVTWDEAIYDGAAFYGPETGTPFEQESCTFTVQ